MNSGQLDFKWTLPKTQFIKRIKEEENGTFKIKCVRQNKNVMEINHVESFTSFRCCVLWLNDDDNDADAFGKLCFVLVVLWSTGTTTKTTKTTTGAAAVREWTQQGMVFCG
jgi:hypothetical protein